MFKYSLLLNGNASLSFLLWINAVFSLLASDVKSRGISTRHILRVFNQITTLTMCSINLSPEATLRINWFKKKSHPNIFVRLFHHFNSCFFLSFIFPHFSSARCLTSYITILYTLDNKLTEVISFGFIHFFFFILLFFLYSFPTHALKLTKKQKNKTRILIPAGARRRTLSCFLTFFIYFKWFHQR